MRRSGACPGDDEAIKLRTQLVAYTAATNLMLLMLRRSVMLPADVYSGSCFGPGAYPMPRTSLHVKTSKSAETGMKHTVGSLAFVAGCLLVGVGAL